MNEKEKDIEKASEIGIKLAQIYLKNICEDAEKLQKSNIFYDSDCVIPNIIQKSICVALVTFIERCIEQKDKRHIVKKNLKDLIDHTWETVIEREV